MNTLIVICVAIIATGASGNLDLVLSALAEGESVGVRAAEVPLVKVDTQHPPLEIETVQLSDTQKETANKFVAECVKETGIKPEVIAEVKKGQFTEDEVLKKFTFCFFEKAGIVDHDGKLNVATALAKLPAGVDKAEAEKVLESFKDKTGKDAAEKTFEILKCYHKGVKNHIFLGF